MKIALIQCPAWGRQNPPFALSLLSAYLRSKGKETCLFDLNNQLFHKVKNEDKKLWQLNNEAFWENKAKVLEFASKYNGFLDNFVNEVLGTDVKVIGFSVFSSSKEFSLLVANKIKKIDKDKKIIFGGPQCAPHMQGAEIIKDNSVDIIAIGEGEVTLNEVVDLIGRRDKLDFCVGTWLKNDGEIIDCGNRALIKNLNELPFADFGDFMLDSYDESNRLPTYLSRGCINRCVFCNENIFWHGYRPRNGQRVFEEIKYQVNKYNRAMHFDFVDSLVNANIKELSHLADLIIKEDLKITWAGQAIIRSYMTAKLLNKLKQSGCVCLAYGIESGSQKILDLMRKRFTVKDAQRVLRDTHNAGIDAVTNFMFGFPGETDDDFRQTLDFISENKKYISTVNPSPAYTAIGVGSYLYEHADEFDLDLSGGHLFWRTKDDSNTHEIRQKRYEAFCNFVKSLNIKFSYNVDIKT